MSHFIFKAKKGPGEIMEGDIEAVSEYSAIAMLASSGYYPLWIREAVYPAVKCKLLGRKINRRTLVNFTRQISELLNSGLTLFDSLSIAEHQIQDGALKGIIRTIKNKIKEGSSFSGSLKSYPRVFSNLYVNLVKSGEAGGILNEALSHLSDFLEKQEDTEAQIINAMLYPALMAGLAFVTMFILMAFVVPKLAAMFTDMGQSLPFFTRILVNFSKFTRSYWHLSFVFIAGFLFLIRRRDEYSMVKNTIDAIKLRMPIIGRLSKGVELERFTRTLSTLLKNGVAMLDALKLAIDAIANEVMKIDLSAVYTEVAAGSSLSSALKKTRHIPHYLAAMIIIGEEGGTLDKMLLKIAQNYEAENNRTIKRLTSLIEPVMILAMGLLVGLIVVSMLLPVFQISLSVH